MLRQASNGKLIARLRFKFAPGQLGSLRFRLPATIAKRLERAHRVKLTAAITARDGARRAHHKNITTKLILRLAHTR